MPYTLPMLANNLQLVCCLLNRNIKGTLGGNWQALNFEPPDIIWLRNIGKSPTTYCGFSLIVLEVALQNPDWLTSRCLGRIRANYKGYNYSFMFISVVSTAMCRVCSGGPWPQNLTTSAANRHSTVGKGEPRALFTWLSSFFQLWLYGSGQQNSNRPRSSPKESPFSR